MLCFCNSGAEANEAAIKLARKHQQRYAVQTGAEITFTSTQSFHGRTLATLTATGQDKVKEEGFHPLPDGFVHVPYNDADALTAITERTGAIMLDFVARGEGGVRPAVQPHRTRRSALSRARSIADR